MSRDREVIPSRRRAALPLAAALALAFAGCTEPKVGDPVGPAPAPGYRLTLTRASVGAQRRVVAVFAVTRDGAPLAVADLPALRPSFTLAILSADPVSGLTAWRSLTLTGAAIRRLPLGGPGTPDGAVLTGVRQPGAETAVESQLTDLGSGTFAFTFLTVLEADFDPARTLRVGAWLGAVPGADATSATLDFTPSGGALAGWETALDARCDACHGRLTAHGGYRRGLRLCLTCHTIDLADPDTVDPAALRRAVSVLPAARSVVAGTAPTAVVAQLLGSAGPASWSISPASGAGALSAASGAAVLYTPPASVGSSTAVTLTARAAGFEAALPITVLPRPAGPAVLVSPAAQPVVAGGPPVALTAELLGTSGDVTWSLSPSSGAGSLSATSGLAVAYLPPATAAAAVAVTVTATAAGGGSGAATLSLLPMPAGEASPATDPNPLDLGRMVHRIHRGKNLPTLYLASSTAPAPPLPPAGTAFPLPFLPGRNAPAPGTRFSITGYRSMELVGGEVVSRSDNGQPARTVAEGIAYPRDLRDCQACHQGAPDGAAARTAIARRTCQGCHPDAWFGAAAITDLTHLAHPGGVQATDARCAGCHVAATADQALLAPIADLHLPLALSPSFNAITVEVISVTGLAPGRHPTVTFTVRDRTEVNGGYLDSLGAPVPATGVGPVPRALGRLAITLAGPSGDLLSGNAPLTEVVPLTATADAAHRFSYTFAAAVPASAAGTWAVGLEARRQAAVPLLDAATKAFQWPYTGETVTEYADNPVVWVDTAIGTWPGGAPAVRRAVIERARCQACHLDLNLHGGLRHNPDYCLMCHTPDGTDWSRRPKGPDGNVNLATAYPDGRIGTYDGLEERSIHFKVMIHRIHTGAGQGTARIDLGAPQVVYGFGGAALLYEEVRFPGPLQTCTACHLDGTWTLAAIPADAQPTTANESGSIVHAGTAAHAAGEAALGPMAAACRSCHGTAFAQAHAASHTTASGVEQCASCHAKGALGVAAVHGLAEPATP